MGPARDKCENVENKLNLCTYLRIVDTDGAITNDNVNIYAMLGTVEPLQMLRVLM